jgi:hypothetical protein
MVSLTVRLCFKERRSSSRCYHSRKRTQFVGMQLLVVCLQVVVSTHDMYMMLPGCATANAFLVYMLYSSLLYAYAEKQFREGSLHVSLRVCELQR